MNQPIMGTPNGSHEYLGGHLGGQIYHSLEHDKIQAEIQIYLFNFLKYLGCNLGDPNVKENNISDMLKLFDQIFLQIALKIGPYGLKSKVCCDSREFFVQECTGPCT